MAFSQKVLAEKIGVGVSTVSSYETGKIIPSLESFGRLCTILELNAASILVQAGFYSTDTEFSALHLESSSESRSLIQEPGAQYLPSKPLYSQFTVSGKAQADISGPSFAQDWRQEANLIQLPSIKGEAFALEVVCDSMEPMFSEGDYVVVRKLKIEEELVTNHIIAVVTAESGTYVKMLSAQKESGDLILRSLNREYSDVVVDRNKCFGIYVAVARYSSHQDGMLSLTSEVVEMREMFARLQNKFPDL